MNEHLSTSEFEENVRLSFGIPQIRSEFVDHLYDDLMRLATAKSRKYHPFFGLRPAWTVVIAILSLMIIGTLVIGPQRVYAEFLKLFGYIPGVGIVDQSAPIRVLAEPVSVTRDDITVTVTSAILTSDRTHLDYRIFGVPGSAYPTSEDVMGCIQQPYLRLPDGTQLNQEKDFLPVPANINEAVYIMPCIFNTLPGTAPENWEIPIRFVPAPPNFTVVPVIESFPSQTPSAMSSTPPLEDMPLVINKVLDIGDQFVLMGEFINPVEQDDSLPAGSWWILNQVSIVGEDGREVPQFFSNDFDLPTLTKPDSEPWLYQLKKDFIPPLTIKWMGEIISPVGPKEQALFVFDAGQNPQAGNQWEVNKDFNLGGFNIRLISIESSSQGYIFHFKADPDASANAISVDIVGYTPNCGGGGGGNDFPEEFDREVCYASFSGSPEFPIGKLIVGINFQALTRQNKSFQVQWSPDIAQFGTFATPTPKPGACVTADSLAQLQPLPATLSKGKALIYEKLDTGTWGLAVYNLDGSQKQVVVPNGNWGALSPDGSQVAYSAFDSRIHIVDLASLTEKVLPGTGGFNLHWSPDGKQIAYVGMGDGVINSVFIITTDGAPPRQISNLSYESIIGWTQVGNLYFVAPYTGGAAWKVYSYDLANTTTQEMFTIENGTPKFLNPKLSPDGEWITYRGRDNSSLYLVHPDGSDMHLVLDSVGAVGIAWTASGWLGVSTGTDDPDAQKVFLINLETCDSYILNGLHGQLEGLVTK